ncbi:MFS transporter [Stomatohabitans albus]|uniref:MFS transporter n=1 Tax=Stomatohabitans albus TaxID=3110766 RepID=UPI00300C415A
MTTFVFTVYLTSEYFPARADEWLGWALGITGMFIALLAPMIGQQADRRGNHATWMRSTTFLITASTFALYWVTPGRLYLGLFLLAFGTLVSEIANMHYNAMLPMITTPERYGRVSGFGWGLGYLGSIICLVALLVGFILPDIGWFGVSADRALNIRSGMVFTGIWVFVFCLPALFIVHDDRAQLKRTGREGPLAAYRRLFKSVKVIWVKHRNIALFLIASAVFRDGLAGIFAFAGVIAAGTFGFSETEVILFAIVANIVAGIITIGCGWIDERVGSRRLIVICLSLLVIFGLAVFFLHGFGKIAFWVCGLALAGCVGPAQSAARTYLTTLTPHGMHTEVFGLYATTGRAVSFLSPTLWALSLYIGRELTGDQSQYWGILGLVSVNALGLLLMLGVKVKESTSPELDLVAS